MASPVFHNSSLLHRVVEWPQSGSVVSELADEKGVGLEFDPALAGNLITLVEAVSIEVDAARRRRAIKRRRQRPKGEIATSIVVELDTGSAGEAEMISWQSRHLDDSPFALQTAGRLARNADSAASNC